MSRPRHRFINERLSAPEQPGDWLPGRMAAMRHFFMVTDGSDGIRYGKDHTILGASPAEVHMFRILGRARTTR